MNPISRVAGSIIDGSIKMKKHLLHLVVDEPGAAIYRTQQRSHMKEDQLSPHPHML